MTHPWKSALFADFHRRLQKFKSLVYGKISWLEYGQHLGRVVEVEPRPNSKAVCSGCNLPGAGYDTLDTRLFEFVPVWNIPVKSEPASHSRSSHRL